MSDTIKFEVRGTTPSMATEKPASETAGFLDAKVKFKVVVPVAARGVADAATAVTVEAEPGKDVVELEFEGGIRQILHPEQLRQDLAGRAGNRGTTHTTGVV